MNDFVKLSWIEACKIGTYLVSTTPSAYANSKEQLLKYFTTTTINTALSEQIFADYIGSAGIYANELHKLKLILSTIHTKTQQEEEALKDYVYALRNMLMHSHYKPVIKHLEKPSTSPASLADFLQYLDEFASLRNECLDPYARTKYMFLYSFIKTILETNKFTTKLSLAQPDAPEINSIFNQYLSFVTQNNEISSLLQQFLTAHHIAEEPLDEETIALYFAQLASKDRDFTTQQLPLKDGAISAVALLTYLQAYKDAATSHYFKKKYAVHEQTFAQFGVNLHEILQHVQFTSEDLCRFVHATQQHDKRSKRKKDVISQIVTTAFAHYLEHTTARLNSQTFQESSPKVTVQKATKSPSHEAALKKELFSLKGAMKQLEAENAQLKKEVKELSQRNLGLEKRVAHSQQQNEQLQQKLEKSTKLEAVSPDKMELVHELAFAVDALKGELHVKDEQLLTGQIEDELVEEETPSLAQDSLEKVQHVKIAVVGGHAKFHTRIKNTFLQEVFTVSPDKLNFDVTKLLNFDVIVFVTSYNNHSLYERSYDYVKRNDGKNRCLIINSQPNPKRLAKLIEEFLSL